MKKIVFILSLVFVAGLTMSTYASQATIDNDVKITIVEDNNDKKPCPADCKAKCCAKEDAKADASATKSDKKCCSSAKKAECSKAKSSDKKASAEKAPAEKK